MPIQLQALQAFADTVQNPDLLRLESLLKRFNLFEAVGAVRHELRHSDFLAFLLDPNRNHGLGTAFLHRFLQAALDLDGVDLSRAYVLREWHHIDILVVDEASRLVVIIENKIDTGEHSDQLNRYRETFQSYFPGHQALGLYLTPNGDAPSSPEDYRAISYSLVCEIIEQTARDNQLALDAEVVMALEHYAQMLRRHIVSDSDIAELCRSIYKQHKQALDLIFEHRPDQQTQIGEYVKSLIQREDGLMLGDARKTWIVFSLKEWKQSPRFDTELFYIYFEFNNQPNELQIFCTIWLGDQTECQKILDMAKKHRFTGCQPRLRKHTCRLSIIQVLRPDDYEKAQEEVEALISEKWAAYLRDELPRMAQAIREEKWLWELP
jgi:hypothetical protein